MNRQLESENQQSRLQQLAGEYFNLLLDYEHVKDEGSRKRLQERKNRLLAEIRALDPDFKEEPV